MGKTNIRGIFYCLVVLFCATVFGFNVNATADPTNLEGSGIKIEFVASGTSSTKVISGLVDNTGAAKRNVYIRLTNMSTQKMTIKGYSQSLATGLSLESLSDMSGIELESGESAVRQLKYSVSNPSTNNAIYNATMVFSYNLGDTYSGDSGLLQAYEKRTYFKVLYRGGNVLPEANVVNSAVGSCDVKLGATPVISSSANLERVFIKSSVSGDNSKTVRYTMDLYVNKSSYSTFTGLGLKFNLQNKNDASGEYTRIEDGKSITYAWSGNFTGSAPTTTFTTDLSGDGMSSGSSGTLSISGSLPTNNATSSDPATLVITVPLQSYKPGTLWVKLKGTLTITINIYTTSSSTSTTAPGERTVLSNLIQQYEESGLISEYSSASAISAYNGKLSTAKNHLAKTDMTSFQLTKDASDLTAAYNTVVNSTNKFSEKNVIKQTNNYYNGDYSVGVTDSNIEYRVYNKSANYNLPYYQDYIDITNRKTNQYNGTITSNINKTYNYWTVDPSELEAKIAEAEALDEDEYVESSWQNLVDKVNDAKNYLTNHPDGSDAPTRNSVYTTYINNITAAIDDLLIKELTIVFQNYDGTELSSSIYQYGQMPVYDGPTPTRERDERYYYTFSGWDKEIEVATVDTTYTAEYSTTDRMYTSTYFNDDGTELDRFEYKYGEEPEYTVIPQKSPTVEEQFIFEEWSVTVDSDGNKTYTAVYESEPREYEIVFVNGSEILERKTLRYGDTPTYDGETPTKPRDDRYVYTFDGWDPEIDVVHSSQIYTATFRSEDRWYTSIYVNDGETLVEFTYKYGEEPEYTEIPTREATVEYTYEFKDWSVAIDDDGNKVYTAEYNAIAVIYNIKFINGGDVIDPISVAYDGVVILPNAKKEGYTFDGWYLDEGLSEKASTEFKMPAEDVTLWGKWAKNPDPAPEPDPGSGGFIPIPATNDKSSYDDTQDSEDNDYDGGGRVIVRNDRNKNYGRAFISVKNDELVKIVPLTEEDKNAMAEGKNIYIYLDVKNISDDVPEKDKTLIDKALENGESIGVYLDISLFKKIADKEEKLDRLYKKIKVSFELPQELINYDENIERVYKVIRVHEGTFEILDSEYENGVLSFETDEFSTYAVVYSDTQKSETMEDETDKGILGYVLLFVIGLMVVVIISCALKAKKKNIN